MNAEDSAMLRFTERGGCWSGKPEYEDSNKWHGGGPKTKAYVVEQNCEGWNVFVVRFSDRSRRKIGKASTEAEAERLVRRLIDVKT